MARPQKYTVDYFPHLCKQGKTIFIIEARYGNDGYAFWFKLLEILATTHGHYFEATDKVQWEFLGAKTRFPVDKMGDILGLLSNIGAIDKDLWDNSKLIWCQNLVTNISDVYENRKGLLPEKPYYQDGILHQNIDNHHNNLVTSPDNTQSKVKETKLNNIITNTSAEKTAPLPKQIIRKYSSDTTKGLAEVLARIDILRGYKLTAGKRKGEAASILRMLTHEPRRSSEEICHVWQKMKSDWWKDKELTMMSVEGQIGAILAAEHEEPKQVSTVRYANG